MPTEVKEADVLTRYAVEARYPGLEEEVTEAEYQVVSVSLRMLSSGLRKCLRGEETKEMLSEHDSIFACGAGDLSLSEQRMTEERREL